MTILPFTSAEITLETAGGKGANLGRLARAGFDVPPGFIIPTESYRHYANANDLEQKIRAALAEMAPADAAALDRASETIRTAFAAGHIPDTLAALIRQAYTGLDRKSAIKDPQSPVAVRSSATTEDLPDLSFAGQQDTYLNVVGIDSLLKAVIDCWSSLWTARAIGYRIRNNIPQDEVSLAVVVQEMVPSESSGVLFTANPLTGRRSESVIDATLGLGEALVSGQVEPDHYVVNTASGEIVRKSIGAKSHSIRPKAGGGTESVVEESAGWQALLDDEIRRVVALGSQIQQEYGAPQDIEWAFAGGKLYLLQSRPITSLFPIPTTADNRPQAWLSVAAVQGVLGPLTPLGLDTFRCMFAGGARMFHVYLDYDEQQVLGLAGERLWIRIGDLLRHPLGAKIIKNVLPMVEPSVAAILLALGDEPGLSAGSGKFRAATFARLARFALPVLARTAATVARPERARADFDLLLERQLENMALTPTGDRYDRLAQRLAFMKGRTPSAIPVVVSRFITLLAPSLAMLKMLNRFNFEAAGSAHGFSADVLEVTRGLPKNVTTEMDLTLWDAAQAIRADPDSLHRFAELAAPELASRYSGGSLPQAAQRAIGAFLDRYGSRGIAEIDIGQPRWSDDPTPVIQTIKSYLQITDPELAPDSLFSRGEAQAAAAVERLAAAARRERGGRLKEHMVRFAARRVRILLGVREAPKFFAVRMLGIVRRHLLESGTDFVAAGILERPDDVFMLTLAELESLSRRDARDWKALVTEHRSSYARESGRRQIPRVLLSDGRAFYEGLGSHAAEGEVITGSPVSPGVVEGVVHVVFDPHRTQLAPGEILVCQGTDPAWTPLFMAAGGLVTEVGGMMTHGSVVAREYGIPAVVGVHQATRRLKDGQRIRLDGTAGKIAVIG